MPYERGCTGTKRQASGVVHRWAYCTSRPTNGPRWCHHFGWKGRCAGEGSIPNPRLLHRVRIVSTHHACVILTNNTPPTTDRCAGRRWSHCVKVTGQDGCVHGRSDGWKVVVGTSAIPQTINSRVSATSVRPIQLYCTTLVFTTPYKYGERTIRELGGCMRETDWACAHSDGRSI